MRTRRIRPASPLSVFQEVLRLMSRVHRYQLVVSLDESSSQWFIDQLWKGITVEKSRVTYIPFAIQAHSIYCLRKQKGQCFVYDVFVLG